MLDQEERLKALDPRFSWIVQAPAGSGKTELLVGRFLTVLAQVQEPEEVLAITFTRKAASEMQARIMGALVYALRNNQPEKNHQKTNFDLARKVLKQDEIRGWKLLEHPSRLRISTIDSLCASLTAMLPMTAKFGENFQVSEQAYLLYEKAIDQLLLGLKDNLPFNSALKSCLLYLDNRLDKFKELLTHMLSRRSMWLDIILKINSEAEFEKILRSSLENMIEESLENLYQEWPEELDGDLWAMLGVYHSEISLPHNDGRIQDSLLHLGSGMGERAKSLSDFQSLSDLLLTDKNQLRKKVDKRQGFLPKTPEKIRMEEILEQLESYPGFIEQLIRIRILPGCDFTHELTPEGQALIQDLIEVLKAAVAYLKITFQAEKTVDFDEISMTALEALGAEDAPTDIMLRLDHRLSHLLVDEYQDTSQLQYRLFSSMVRGWQKNDGRTVFLVGDPMQSIYKFRQADVGLFLKTIDQGLGPVHLNFIQLKINFRSSPEIISWINQTFEQLFPKSKEGMFGAVTYAPSWPAEPFTIISENDIVSPLVGETGQQALPVGQRGGYTHSGVKTILKTSPDLLALELAQEIINHKNQHPEHAIAILVRARTHLDPVLKALAIFNIDYQGVEIQRLFSKSEILDCLNLTYAIFDLKDALSWMALFRSPVFGFELKDLLSVRLEEGLKINSDNLSEHARARLDLLMPIIQEALLAKHREPLSTLIKKLWVSLGFLDYLKNSNQIEAIENTERYFELLKKITPRHRLPEREYLEKLLENLFARSKVTNPNPVEIMTVHKSKGLEFDHVFLFMPNKTARALDKPLFLFQDRMNHKNSQHELLIAPHRAHKETQDSPLYKFLYELEKEKENHEAIRLLYVAVTRAKSYLSLFGEIELNEEGEIKKPKSGSSLAWFWPALSVPPLCPVDIPSPGLSLPPGERRNHQDDPEGHYLKRLNKNSQSAWVLDHGISDSAAFVSPLVGETDGAAGDGREGGKILNHPEIPELNLEPKILGTIAHAYLEKLSKLPPLCPSADAAGLSLPPGERRSLGMSIKSWEQNILQDCESAGARDPGNMTQKIIQACDYLLSSERGRWILNPDHEGAASELALWDLDKEREFIIDRTFIADLDVNVDLVSPLVGADLCVRPAGEGVNQKTRIIIDYKFSEPRSDQELKIELEKYTPQLKNYEKLMRNLDQNKYPVRLFLVFPLVQKEVECF